MLSINDVAESLALEPHPEGGWYRRFWASPETIETRRGGRNLVTSIHYLLPADEESRWHRIIGSQETWVWQDGGELLVKTGGTGDEPLEIEQYRLGRASAGCSPHVIVEPSQWQSAAVLSGDWVLLACFVSPGFDFEDWQMYEPLAST